MVPPEDNGGFAAHKLIDAVRSRGGASVRSSASRAKRGSSKSWFVRHPRRRCATSSLRSANWQRSRDYRRPSRARSRKAGVIGAGTMGSGIAITFAQAGIPVVVVDSNDEAVDKARQTVMGMFMYQVQKGKLTQEEAWKRGQSISVYRRLERTCATSTSSSKPFLKIWTSRNRCSKSSTRSSSPRRSSPRTPRRSMSMSWPRSHAAAGASSSAYTSLCRRTSCRCSKSCAARHLAANACDRLQVRQDAAQRRRYFQPTPSALSATA